jgi:putative membrane protein
MMGGYGSEIGTLGWLGICVFWLLLLGLIIWLVTSLLPGSKEVATHTTRESALEILDRRLASGEIDLATWQALRAALMSKGQDRAA